MKRKSIEQALYVFFILTFTACGGAKFYGQGSKKKNNVAAVVTPAPVPVVPPTTPPSPVPSCNPADPNCFSQRCDNGQVGPFCGPNGQFPQQNNPSQAGRF